MAITITLEENYKESLVGLYPIEDSSWDNVVNYCKNKVIAFASLKAHRDISNDDIGAFKTQCLVNATKAEIESYLTHGGDLKDLPNVDSVGNVKNYTVDDTMLCPIAKEWVKRAGFMYRGLD